MATKIFKTEELAVLAAKTLAAKGAGKSVDQINDKEFHVMEGSPAKCDCGETPAVDVAYFDEDQVPHYGRAGYCETCGDDSIKSI